MWPSRKRIKSIYSTLCIEKKSSWGRRYRLHHNISSLSNGFGYDCAAAAALTACLLQHCVSSKISPTITDSLIGLIIAREGGKKREREGEESREGSDKCWQYCFSNIIYSSPLWERRLIFPVITTARWEIGQSDREVRKRGNRRRMTVGKRANVCLCV